MHVLALRISLRFPSSHSLKEKRMLMRPIIDGLRSNFQVSVAEIAHHDTWQRCDLGVALVGGQVGVLEKAADQIDRFVWQAADTEILEIERQWMDS